MISKEVTLTHRHAMECALSSPYSRVHSLTIRKDSKNSSSVESLARSQSVQVLRESPKGSMADMEMRISWDLFEKWKEYRSAHLKNDVELIVFLDHLNDPQNVGNIIRTAQFFGASAVVIPSKRSVKLGDTVIRTSTGAALSLPIIHCSNLVRAMESFQEEGAYIWGLDASAEQVLSSEKPVNSKLGLVIGSEGEGMAKLTQKTCDLTLKLSKEGFHESLNASSAAAIGIYECVRKVSQF